ncbi:hypothetical protein M514_09674 [Trichuris suis]|uniref:MD-2-related lipid-recognition domain-containing protein n=1 Tax=Trichuris suis TaxID=68888 RepID=A0A085N2C7_9BILA|nr:hypothetical protein M514_09674 [Trichuris suis]
MLSCKKVLKCALLVLAYCIYADGTFVHYANCGSKAKVIWVQVDPCDDPYDCSLMKGGSVTFTVQLISDNAIKNLSSAAYVKLARLPHQVKLPVFGACENAGSTCNVQAGSAVTYRTQFLISKRLPKIDVTFRFLLFDQNQEMLVCVRLIAHIDEPISSTNNSTLEMAPSGQPREVVVAIAVCSICIVVLVALAVYFAYKKIKQRRKCEGQYWPAYEEEKNCGQNLPPLPPPAIEGLI